MRQYSFPKGHWNWPISVTHQQAVRAGEMIFTGGQMDLDSKGNLQNHNDLRLQAYSAMAAIRALLEDLGAEIPDLVKLVIYYVGDANDEALLLQTIAESISYDCAPVVSLINNPQLCYSGLLVQIEGIAMRSEDGSKVARHNFRLDDMPFLPEAFSHVVHAGDMVFTSDISARTPEGDVAHPEDLRAQTTLMMERLTRAMSEVGADMSDMVKLNTFYLGNGTAEDWEVSAKIRADYFADPGPAATGIPLPSFPHHGLTTKICATAMLAQGEYAAPLSRKYIWPEGHWNWTAPLPYKHGNRAGQVIHIGGQVALDINAQVLHPDDMTAQTQIAMGNISSILEGFDATLNNLVKVTAFYQGGASAKDLHENLRLRSAAFSETGPATTCIPVNNLVYEHMIIEIEAIAVLDI